MTNQEAINYLLDPIGKREQHDEAIKMAVSALEKQIPVKPDFVEDYSSFRLYCPKCHHYFGTKGKHSVILFDMPNYCDCGQAIDWEVDG